MTIERKKIKDLLGDYPELPAIGAVASHSALDIFDGAVMEGFRTFAICKRGRERTYTHYFRASRDEVGNVTKGCVDESRVLEDFKDILKEPEQQRFRDDGVLIVPNRALSSYLPPEDIENKLLLPIIGSRNMLRLEEREDKENYYGLLKEAGIPFPPRIEDPKSIDGLSVVKIQHAEKPLERGFFTASTYDEYKKKSDALVAQGVIKAENLPKARIERYIIGPIFNLNFFFSPLAPRFEGLELLGIDERRESSLDGLVRLPADQQLSLTEKDKIPGYRVVGHGSLTLRESLLEEVFRMGEKFVDTASTKYSPGIIGPFCLQAVVDKDGKFTVFDVSLRIGGGTNIHMAVGHPYGNALWHVPMSTGRRLALEVRRALREGTLSDLVT